MLTVLVRYIVVSLMLISSANAHIGHVGEVAGHGHLIGLAGLAAAAAMAALLAMRAKNKAKKETVESDADSKENIDDDVQDETGELANG